MRKRNNDKTRKGIREEIKTEERENFENINFKIKTKRVELAYNYLKSLPCKYRKYENCKSYIHSVRIAQKMKTESLIIIALFHDILEDFGEEKREDLKKLCTKAEVEVIELLTRKEKESYEVYIKKLSKNPMACFVKMHDMLDNLKTATPENKSKYKKFLFELYFLG